MGPGTRKTRASDCGAISQATRVPVSFYHVLFPSFLFPLVADDAVGSVAHRHRVLSWPWGSLGLYSGFQCCAVAFMLTEDRMLLATVLVHVILGSLLGSLKYVGCCLTASTRQ